MSSPFRALLRGPGLCIPLLLAGCHRPGDTAVSSGDTGGPASPDEDGDGWTVAEGDCDDTDDTVHPEATETCNDRDDDCDGLVDDDDPDVTWVPTWYLDEDGDGWGVEGTSVEQCDAPDGYAYDVGDCDDDDPDRHPEADEVCDDKDNDCDDRVDDEDDDLTDALTGYADEDGDGFGDADTSIQACTLPSGYVQDDRDCDDQDAAVNPEAEEVCEDGIDNDCDGEDDTCPFELHLAEADGELVGERAGDQAGESVDDAGDVDGNGHADVIVGARLQSDHRDEGGAAYLVLREPSGILDLSTAEAVFLGTRPDHRAGTTVAGLSDLDLDGYAELAVGVPGDSTGADEAGAVYLVSGPVTGEHTLDEADLVFTGEQEAMGLHRVAAAGDVNADGWPDVMLGSELDATNGTDAGAAWVFLSPLTQDLGVSEADARLLGRAAGQGAASALATAGDVDADGYDDLLIGASNDFTVAAEAGAVFLVRGPVYGDLGLEEADATLQGREEGDALGTAVATGGDANADGYADVLVGAPGHDTGWEDAGVAWLFLGPVTGSLHSGDAHAELRGESPNAAAGTRVDGGQDLDGDGYDDLLVGAPYESRVRTEAGRIYALPGPVTGGLDLGSALGILDGEAAEDWAGSALSLSGDLHGDGWPDILVGAWGNDSGGGRSGAVHVVSGDRF